MATHGAEKWSIANGEYGGKPLIIRLNMGADTLLREGRYPYRVGIAVPLLHPEETGLPIKEENEIFLGIEDTLLELLDKEGAGVLCAVISTNGMKEFMLYVNNEDVSATLELLRKDFSSYDFQHYVTEDRKAEGYEQLRLQVV